jgi:hypothetical protein
MFSTLQQVVYFSARIYGNADVQPSHHLEHHDDDGYISNNVNGREVYAL